MSTQPIALWLADKLEDIPSFDGHWLTINNAANELRRLHEESERLKAAAQRQWVGLDAAEWFKWWRTATVLGHTQAEIDFADFLMIALAVQDVLGKKNGGQV